MKAGEVQVTVIGGLRILVLKEKRQIVLVVSPGKVKPRLENQCERAETVRPAVDQVAGAEKAIFLLVETLPGQFIEQTLPMAVDVTHDEVMAVLIGRVGLEENHLNDSYWPNRAFPIYFPCCRCALRPSRSEQDPVNSHLWLFMLCMLSDIVHDKTM